MPWTLSHAYAFRATEGTCVRSVRPSRLQLTLLTAELFPHPFLLTTGSRPGLRPTSLPGEPFWETQLRSLPPPPILTLVLAFSPWGPSPEMLADLTAGDMYTLGSGAQIALQTTNLFPGLADLLAGPQSPVHASRQNDTASVLKEIMGRLNGFLLY